MTLVQNLVLILFLISSAVLLARRRREGYGVIVSENGKILADGRQGLTVSIGRGRFNDVRLTEPTVSRAQATVRYDPHRDGGKFLLTEWGHAEGECHNREYWIAGHSLLFSLPDPVYTAVNGAFPLCCALILVALQAVSTFLREQMLAAILPHFLLIVYLLAATLLRADRTPLCECILAILLTYYTEAVLYPISRGAVAGDCIRDAVVGVFCYTGCALAASIALKLDFNRKVGSRPLHRWLRIPVVFAIFVLIALNLALAKNVNGAYNWITVAGIRFQPSELVKVLLVFALILPDGRRGISDWFYLLILPGCCMLYGLLIKDTGVLLQFAILTAAAILLQYRSMGSPLLLVVVGFIGARVVLLLSSTAAARFYGWLGNDFSLWESMTAAGVLADAYDYGYQSTHALVAAFCNGGLLGNSSYDVLSAIPAANSDLVTSLIAQRHGWPILFLLFGLFFLLVLAASRNRRQQTRFQQMFSCLGVTLLVMAMGMNLAGTFGLFPLTGVVCPALSDGISAAIGYGFLFGSTACSGFNS